MADTAIEWTDKTWNPTTGCDKVSPGCDNCYAMTMAKRLKGMGSAKYQNDGNPRTSGPGFLATEHESDLGAPLRWRKPARVFVNSMSDLFHERISDEFIARVFAVMALARQHTFQVLTKRHGRMRALLNSGRFADLVDGAQNDVARSEEEAERSFVWPLPNVWLGVSVEDQKWSDLRIPALLDTPTAVRFLSCEPLLGPVDLDHTAAGRISYWLTGRPDWKPAGVQRGGLLTETLTIDPRVDWVIAGGESGPGARPMHPDWARQLRDQCATAGVPFHFKQWGEWTSLADREHLDLPAGDREWRQVGQATMVRVGKKAAGRELDGRTWDEFPDA